MGYGVRTGCRTEETDGFSNTLPEVLERIPRWLLVLCPHTCRARVDRIWTALLVSGISIAHTMGSSVIVHSHSVTHTCSISFKRESEQSIDDLDSGSIETRPDHTYLFKSSAQSTAATPGKCKISKWALRKLQGIGIAHFTSV